KKRIASPNIAALNNLDKILDRTEVLFKQKKNSEIISLLSSLEDNIEFANQSQELNYLRYLIYALANSNKLVKAEKYLRRAIKLDPSDKDFLFAGAFIYTSFKEHEEALTSCRKFIEISNCQNNPDINYLSDHHRHLIYNYQGLALKGLNRFDQAEKAFQQAISANRRDAHPYLNLANLYRQQKKYDKAKEIIEIGIKECSQVQELRLFKKSLENIQTISACMMVKNEEELLPNCLESIRNWVDEIIIVDTGSTDRTIEIARSYGAKIYFQEWSKDFSKHRNFSISKATCDWIFIIDADEEFIEDGLTEVHQAMNLDKYRIISVNVFNMDKNTGEYSSFLPSNRFFRRDANLKYGGIVHNQLQYPETEVIPRTNARINHFGYNLDPEKMNQKLKRSMELLEQQLDENQDNVFAHFNYAQLLRSCHTDDELERAIIHARKTVEMTDMDNHPELHLQGYHQQATANFSLKRYKKAEEVCLAALKLKPDYLDPILTLGHIYAAMEKIDEAVKYFEKYLNLQAKYDPSQEILNIILLYVNARHIAHYGIGLLEYYRKDFKKAEVNFLKVLKYQDPYQDTYLKLATIYLDTAKPDKALPYIEKQLAVEPKSALTNIAMARYFGMKNDDFKVEEYMAKALKFASDEPEIYERSGVYWANKGEFEKATFSLEKLVEFKPNYEHGLRLLSKVYYDSCDFENARESYIRYLDMAKLDPESYYNLANSCYKMNDFEKAEIFYIESLSLDENNALSYRNLGLTKMRLGKFKEALPLLEKYINTAPDDIDICFAIGAINCQLERYSEAIPYFEQLLSQSPNNIDGLFGISECYLQLGHGESAAIGYMQILKIQPDFQPAIGRLKQIETSIPTA
ncbi:MAG: tetratricopeptide repeat protein, partial [Candidatus Zixiibacteriota bacterium]